MDNHKGQQGPCKPILICQEGYCRGCQVFSDWCDSLAKNAKPCLGCYYYEVCEGAVWGEACGGHAVAKPETGEMFRLIQSVMRREQAMKELYRVLKGGKYA